MDSKKYQAKPSAENVPRFVKLAPRIVTNLKIPIANNVPPPAVNAPKNAIKWLNKQKPFDCPTKAGQRADFL